MISTSQNTALLIFARSSKKEAELKVKRNQKPDYSFAKFLNNKATVLAENSGLPFFIIDEEKQVGNTFGERLAHAFQSVFNQGYESVISIGNDCPGLKADDLIDAANLLTQQSAVIGPDLRKGAYLIGMNQDQFNSAQFAKLDWQSKNTFKSLIAYFDESELLEVKSDYNDLLDLQNVLADLSSKSVKQLILKITGLFQALDSVDHESTYAYSYSSPQQERGPPSSR